MAFRKRFPRARRRFSKPLARKRTTWIQTNIDPCDPVVLEHCTPTDGCCTDIARIELVGQTTLQDQFSDRCTAVRILGDLWFQQVPGTIVSGSAAAQWLTWLQSSQHFLGLKRAEVTSQSPFPPAADIWDPSFDDLSEAQWMKTWQKYDNGFNHVEFSSGANLDSGWTSSHPVRGSNVHTEVATVEACIPFTGGTGTLCIATDMEDDCLDCGQSLDAGQITFGFSGTRSTGLLWHVHLDVKKKIPLRENQVLYLNYNLRHHGGVPPVSPADSFSTINGNVRTLIQMG